MTCRLAAALVGLTAISTALPLLGAEGPAENGPKQSFEVTKTERMDFLPGGTIRLDNSYGYLTVEGWDEKAVEITVTKSTDRLYQPEPKEKAQADRRFSEIAVVAERRSDKELSISTATPLRHNFVSSILPARRVIVTLPKHSRRGVTVDYTVHVPRDSRLVIRHDNGYVWVNDVTGDIDVRSHTGDMIVMLPDPGPYSIDARTRLGSVSSDFIGKARNLSQFLMGTHFTYASQAASRRVYLRMGRGSITIKNGPPSGPFWKD
jgi:hypothetical protein